MVNQGGHYGANKKFGLQAKEIICAVMDLEPPVHWHQERADNSKRGE